MTKLRIFIACADKRLRTAMFLLLDQEPAMVVVGIIDQLPELLPQLKVVRPDVLLLEWEEPSSLSMANLMTDIRNLEHPLKVIYFSNNPEEEEKARMDGVDYYICKNAPPDSLLPILQKEQASKTKISIEKEELHTENITGTTFANRAGVVPHHQNQKNAQQDTPPPPQQYTAPVPQAPAQADLTPQIQQLSQLHNAGVLTDEEFEAVKQKLLSA